MKKEHLILYPTCIVVKGTLRSTICDLEKEEFHYVPNGMIEILDLFKNEDYQALLLQFTEDERAIIIEYKEFLLKNDLAFFTKDPILYPEMEKDFFSPSKVENAILDRNEYSTYDIFNAIEELDKINCKHLQIRLYSTIKIDELNSILEKVQNTDLLSVEVFYKYNFDEVSKLKDLINSWTKIKLFLVHSAPSSEVITMNERNFYTSNMGNFLYTNEKIKSEQNCGCISKSFFSINVDTFAESFGYNTCLNKKLSIDTQGKLKNCPTLTKDYGSFGSKLMSEVIEDQEYLSYGKIKKDQIETCKDCEHRHMCTDCRAFVTNIFDKPFKCSYDPYTAKWHTK